jgi:2-deoxy-D-gluconate 3-dehydrogenase
MDTSKFNLKGKVALVVGGAGDLGKAIAHALADAGANIVVLDRREDQMAEAVKELSAHGTKVGSAFIDLGKIEGFQALVEGIVKDYGRIDILINSAGASFIVPMLEVSEKQWDIVMNVNVKGPAFLTRAVAQAMINLGNGGSIINMASYMGLKTEENLAPYCTSKAAMIHLTKCMAKEWGKHNVRVNCIAPAWIYSRLADPFLGLPGINDRMLAQSMLGRFGLPDDVASLALYLATDAAKNQTAGVFPLDYGMLA